MWTEEDMSKIETTVVVLIQHSLNSTQFSLERDKTHNL